MNYKIIHNKYNLYIKMKMYFNVQLYNKFNNILLIKKMKNMIHNLKYMILYLKMNKSI